MAKVIGKEQLCSSDLKYFKSLQGIGGRTLFDRYKHAESNIIDKYIASGYKDFLAYPVQIGSEITFHGIKYNEVPQFFSDLQGEDLERYGKIKDETLTHYNSAIDTLRNSGKTTEAEYLANAIKYVDDRFVYCYDGRVVLGAWGMQLRNDVREDISEIRKNLVEKKKKILPVSDTPPLEPALEPTPEPIDDGPTAPPPIDPPVPQPPPKLPWWKRFWIWLTGLGCLKWLLWLLLLLLLLLLFCWLFRSCNGPQLVGGAALSDNDSTWLREDPSRRHGGGTYDPYDPYHPTPTPPAYKDVLPPHQAGLFSSFYKI